MKRSKTQKGITLVALIITIIVLLILAVVAIRAVQGDGIIAHAKNARDNSIEAQDKEAILLALNEWKIVSATSEKTFENFMKEKFGSDKVQPGSSENEVIVTLENGNQYKVKTDGIIEDTKGISISATALTLILASEETKTAELSVTLSGSNDEISWSNSDATKATLSSTKGKTITVTGVAVGETIITVTCGNYSKTCKVTVLEKLDHSEVVVPTVAKTGIYASSPNIKEVRKGVKADIPIPVGFTYIKGDDIGGAVITDDDENEFVWVPTTTDIVAYGVGTTDYREPDVVTGNGSEYDAAESNLKRVLEGEYAEAKTAASFKAQLTAEFNKMTISVNKYHGFYVSRYEMSYEETAQSKVNKESARNTSAENNWYGLYAKAKTYAPENSSKSVVSRMIYGSQYNAMMIWMSGNGIDVTKTTPTDLSIGVTVRNSDTNRRTGSQPKDKLSNIFDLLGNNREWTQDAFSKDSRRSFGGHYNAASSPRSHSSNIPTYTVGYYSSRLSLYVK